MTRKKYTSKFKTKVVLDTLKEQSRTVSKPTGHQDFKTDPETQISNFELGGKNSTKNDHYINKWASRFSKDVGKEEIDTLRMNWTGYIEKNPILKKSIDSSVDLLH